MTDLHAHSEQSRPTGDDDLLEAARLMLSRMGVDPHQLAGTGAPPRPMPTFDQYVPVVADAVSEPTRKAYSPYWKRARTEWGSRRLDDLAPTEIQKLAKQVKASAVVRSNSRGGRGSEENFLAALRCLYRHAERDNLIDEAANPALKVAKPRRLQSARRALSSEELAEINHVGSHTGDDPELDSLILRLHEETAGRRGGGLALTLRDLDDKHCLVRLREKGETIRWQPISPTLMTHLLAHAEQRDATEPTDQVLRYRHGVPISYRRYDHLWLRIGRHLPWVAAHAVSTHWLRHTTLTWVERNFGFAVAHAYAGHFDDTDSATTTYIKASLREIAAALATLTGEPHPMAH